MEFLQAISITGWGRESCTASSQFFFQHAHFSYCALDYLKRSPPRSVTKFLSVYHSRFKIGYLYGTFYHADVTFSNRNNNFSDILPKRKMPTINNTNFILASCNSFIVETSLSLLISFAQPVVIQFFAINRSTQLMK